MFQRAIIILLFISGMYSCTHSTKDELPNIIIIYADDMGFGDLNYQNPDSKIPTPNIDNLASEGMHFSDAHSSSGICSPSRFALLTGTFHWRRQHNIVGVFGKPFFEDTDVTIPQLLKTKGYTTACIGKWHLGWDWNIENDSIVNGINPAKYSLKDIDWNKTITGGPLDRGFDYYFGDGTINFPPYAWIENNSFLQIPNAEMNSNNIGFDTKEGSWEFRPGPKVAGWNPYDVLPTLTGKTVDWIGKQKNDEPFFLYFSLPAPHAPIIPNDEFDGKSEAGAYGDFMFQTDWVIGQVLNKLKGTGLEENTIVIFSSDNGPELYAFDRAIKYNHFSAGNFRGLKRDVWEGGHHVPLIIKWPKKIKQGTRSAHLISQTDIMATIAAITGVELPENAGRDSQNFLPLLTGKSSDESIRDYTIHNTFKGVWGVRKNDWLYINNSTGGHTRMPEDYSKLKEYTPFDSDVLLFNLREDPGQKHNLSAQFPDKIQDKIQELDSVLQKSLSAGYYETNRNINN